MARRTRSWSKAFSARVQAGVNITLPGYSAPGLGCLPGRRSGDVDERADRRVRIHAAGIRVAHLYAAQALRRAVLRPQEAVQRVAPVEVAHPGDSRVAV